MSKFPLPDEALIPHTAILGKTGSGKTTTGKDIVEHLVGLGARVCILDPVKSDWWGLTSSADGKKAGLPFQILGGPKGHVPLHDTSGKVIAEIVAAGTLPLSILDMADFGPGAQMRFFTEFAPRLLQKMRGVLHLVIEEAHIFAPKERGGPGGYEALSIHWAKMLATAGRSKGIRMIVLTQRTQALHNAVLGSCDTMIAHRLTAPADQKPVNDWLKANVDKEVAAKVAASLSSLKTGTGWVCSSEVGFFEQIAFPRIKTYDNSATPTGDLAEIQVRMATVDVDRLRSIVGEAVAVADANDPAKLRAELAAAQAELVKARKGAPVAGDTEEAKRSALETARQAGALVGAQAVQDKIPALLEEQHRYSYADGYLDAAEHLSNAVKGVADTLSMAKPDPIPPSRHKITAELFGYQPFKSAHPAASRPAAAKTASPAAPPSRPRPAGGAGIETKLPTGEAAILKAAAQFGPVERTTLTVLLGYKRSSRNEYVKRLVSRGLVETVGDAVSITPAGLAALPADYEPLPTGAALQDWWMERLSRGEVEILKAIARAHPNAIERETLDGLTGLKQSSRNEYLKRMAAKQIVEFDRNSVRLSKMMGG